MGSLARIYGSNGGGGRATDSMRFFFFFSSSSCPYGTVTLGSYFSLFFFLGPPFSRALNWGIFEEANCAEGVKILGRKDSGFYSLG